MPVNIAGHCAIPWHNLVQMYIGSMSVFVVHLSAEEVAENGTIVRGMDVDKDKLKRSNVCKVFAVVSICPLQWE